MPDAPVELAQAISAFANGRPRGDEMGRRVRGMLEAEFTREKALERGAGGAGADRAPTNR
jgi:hypothetical protein